MGGSMSLNDAPRGVQIIVGFLFWLAIPVVAIMAVMTGPPLLIGLAAFLISLPFWIDNRLRRSPVYRRHLSVELHGGRLVWRFIPPDFAPFRAWVPLAVGLLTTAGVMYIWVPAPHYFSIVSPGFWAAAYNVRWLVFWFPIVGIWRYPDLWNRFLAFAIERILTLRFRQQAHLLTRILAIEGKIVSRYEAMGIVSDRAAPQDGSDVILRYAIGGANPAPALTQSLAQLKSEWAGLKRVAARANQVQAAFDRAKAVVIRQGSPTLLDELDRVHLGFHSDLLGQVIAAQQWGDAAEIYDLMEKELEAIQAAAERGEAAPARDGSDAEGTADMPQTLDEAYAVLNVSPGTRKTVIKKLVDALRMSWHPDLGADEAARAQRHAQIQRINVAWDIVNAQLDEG